MCSKEPSCSNIKICPCKTNEEIKDRQKLISALKSVTKKLSNEFIEESLTQLFDNISQVIPMETNELNTRKSKMTDDLINRLEIYKADIALLEIQEIINSSPLNQEELLDMKSAELDSFASSSSPSLMLMKTIGMVTDKHKGIFDKLDSFIKDYPQEAFETILYTAEKSIRIYKSEEYTDILFNTIPYITSQNGISALSNILSYQLDRKQDSFLTHKILFHLEKFPESLYKVIDDIFSWWYGKEFAFNLAFPYLAGNDEYRDKIIEKAISEKKLFDAIVPYLSYEDQCSVPTFNPSNQCFVSQDYNQHEESFLIGEL